MDLSIKKETIGGEVNFLDSEQYRVIKRGLTIDYTTVKPDADNDDKRILEAGSRLGQITATDKYAPVINTTLEADASSAQAVIEPVDIRHIQSGDTLVVEDDTNSETKTVASVDETAGTVTLETDLTNSYTAGATVRKDDGSQTAEWLLFPHDLDLTDGDHIASGIDWGRVIESRLPGTVSEQEKADLNEIKMV